MILFTLLANFSEALFTIASGLVGVFLFLLMILTGWMERTSKPFSSKILLTGGTGLIIVWLWIQIALRIKGALP